MLSPIDFIYNNATDIPYLLESQFFADKEYYNNYSHPVVKITNPYNTSISQCDLLELTASDLTSIYENYLYDPHSKRKQFPENSPYFPGVRFLSPGIVVFERPPTYQIVDLDHDFRDNLNDDTSSSQYYIPLPWQVYVCTYNPEQMRLHSVKMFFANSYLSDINQTVYVPPMFNFYSNGTLCRPFFPSMEDIEKYPQDINGIIASAYDWVWNSGFNFDITENIAYFLSKQKFEEFSPWAESSAPKSLSFLRENRINGLPRITIKSYFQSFFKCWESVPLEEISTLTWCNYTNSEFYYQELNNVSENFFYEYVSSNNIVLCQDYEEDMDPDDEDYEHYCDDCISADALRDSDEYREAFMKAYIVSEKSIKHAINQTISDAKAIRVIDPPPNMMALNKSFVDIYQKYASQG